MVCNCVECSSLLLRDGISHMSRVVPMEWNCSILATRKEGCVLVHSWRTKWIVSAMENPQKGHPHGGLTYPFQSVMGLFRDTHWHICIINLYKLPQAWFLRSKHSSQASTIKANYKEGHLVHLHLVQSCLVFSFKLLCWPFETLRKF